MSVRVIARIRPLLKSEIERDTIVSAVSAGSEPASAPTVVRIPNPRNENEDFNFQFNSVYGPHATQQEIFENEVAPTVKHLFDGFDVTLFAYGVTGTGKTHTMRGGKSLADRGVIPRLLSGIYRRSRKIEKDAKESTSVEVSMSYYEIYNDKVFDLFEAPEKRTMTGLQLRDNGGKTIVVGLTERPCENLKDFERLYDQANVNRSTSATKLNAHSSRSHAVLCVKVSMTTGDKIKTSVASAIDLAGSEDNRRTENGKERLIESASINKSLFVLAQCVEAISKKQARVPYRESKMTRILSLGQNNGLTVMILNIAPVKSYHLDTLSSLNFANRTKKIELKEVENQSILVDSARSRPSVTGPSIQRQPLRPIASTVHNATIRAIGPESRGDEKPKKPKAFSVYSDQTRQRLSNSLTCWRRPDGPKRSSPLKRPSDSLGPALSNPNKSSRSSQPLKSTAESNISQAFIEGMVEKKVTEILAARALEQPHTAPIVPISEDVQRRLDLLEQKIDSQDDSRAQGLSFLLMAKQHYARGENTSALKMYELAREYFPNNDKLEKKILKLRKGMKDKRAALNQIEHITNTSVEPVRPQVSGTTIVAQQKVPDDPNEDSEYQEDEYSTHHDYESDDGFRYRSKSKKAYRHKHDSAELSEREVSHTPRTKQLLNIINTRDLARIKSLKGVGARKAESIFEALCTSDSYATNEVQQIISLGQLSRLRGVGVKTVENMRLGLEEVF